MSIKCIIVVRDLECRDKLRVMLSQYPFINVCAAFESNAEAARFALPGVRAIFSDSPFDELLNSTARGAALPSPVWGVRGAGCSPPFFVASVEDGESAIAALKNNVSYLLLTPYKSVAVANCVENLRKEMVLSEVMNAVAPPLVTSFSEEIKVPGRSHPLILKLADVAAIKSMGDYTQLITDEGVSHVIRRTIRAWTKILEHTTFLPTDRSVIINLAHVVSYQMVSRDSARVCLKGSREPLHLGRRGILRLNKEYKARPPQF
jgi:DNA-binding LytR/AlgR family response regulator